LGAALAVRRAACGISQGELGRVTNYSRTSISHIEAGRQFPGCEFWEKVDEVCEAQGVLISQYKDSCERVDGLRRIDFERQFADQVIRLREVVPGGVDLTGDFSSDAPRRSTESLELSDVAAMRAMSDAFQSADRKIGGGKLYRAVVRYLASEVSPQLLSPVRGSDGVDIFSAAASLTEIAGWMAHDGGSDERAKRHFDRAYRLSTSVDNLALAANVCASMSHLATQLGNPRDGIRIAEAGLSRAQRACGVTQLRARLFVMRARGLSLAGDVAGCLKSLRLAEQILERSAADETASWIAGFDYGSLAGEAALCLQTLGKLKEAENQAKLAVELRGGDRVRSRAFANLILADVLVQVGRIDEAAEIGVGICDALVSLSSARVRTGLETLAGILRKDAKVPKVEEFLHRSATISLDGDSPSSGANAWPV
jgi:transcriptional regulator with XRE-family HTH domain